ncbi:hypothetical protein SFRURICE_000135 [Spodoptera frugiperda]|nr:hypothetical protein SFRURICE_000135 [Spodoptera frugiperda]
MMKGGELELSLMKTDAAMIKIAVFEKYKCSFKSLSLLTNVVFVIGVCILLGEWLQARLSDNGFDSWSLALCSVYGDRLFYMGLITRMLGFSPVTWVCLQTYKFTYTHVTQLRNNNLWITQRVAPWGNRTRCTLYGSQLPSHPANPGALVNPLGSLQFRLIYIYLSIDIINMY